ncbi:MAG: phenylacetate-CoA oxygenase subunit PaaC [Chloroflexota bacterium]|nr:phenylacetate-CoA oxygenase subunit PaaC [Chloroflexota bacterium]
MTSTQAAEEVQGAALTPLAGLLLSLADDEFVLGYWDSEWTGIAPVLEEDVAFSSLAQDEIGHAKAYYELLAHLTGGDADSIAYGRQPEEYRHARLPDHPRTDWAFSVARRYLYDSADAVRLESLAASSHQPLADLVAKIRREEAYHLMHGEAWLRRLASVAGEPRERLTEALKRLWPDAPTVFTPIEGEGELVRSALLPDPMWTLQVRWLARLEPLFRELRLPFPFVPTTNGYEPEFALRLEGGRCDRGDSFRWLWAEFTSVARLEQGATW